MVIYINDYQRQGNDAWLKDYIEIRYSENKYLTLYHKKDWTGWAGTFKDENTLELDVDNIEESQKQIDVFLKENDLDEITIDLKHKINNRY